jgi:hypothetical protein
LPHWFTARWHADGQAAGDRGREGQRLSGGRVDEQVLVGGGRRGLPAVDGGDLVRAGVVVDQVAATADARDERVGHAEGRRDGDGRVGGGATPAQHVEPGLGGLDGVGHDRATGTFRHRLPGQAVRSGRGRGGVGGDDQAGGQGGGDR